LVSGQVSGHGSWWKMKFVEEEVISIVDSHVWSRVWFQVSPQVDSYVDSRVWSQIDSQIDSHVRDQIWDQIEDCGRR